MKNNKLNRYVGVAPFQPEQKDIFFGRDSDSEKLYSLVSSQQQVLLYAKSGLGKSSLINAGLLPKLSQNENLQVIQIRFGAYQEERSISPLDKMLSYLPPSKPSFLDKIIENENSLWYRLKSWQLAQPNIEFLLIFDQFEEVFSYPEDQLFSFKKQMADLFYSSVPQNFRKVLQIKEKKNPDLLSQSELLLLNQSLAVKSLMSIREDRYSQMNLLADYLPDAMHNRYALAPLDREQARQAVIAPASMEGDFNSEKFSYMPDALEKILNFLTKENTQSVETTQLQILCNRLENLRLPKITERDIPNFEDIFLQFYEESISKTDSQEQAKVRRFVENELVKKGQRISLDELICFDFVSKKTLELLVNTHLLRAERNNTGGISYELSHDTLVTPILQAKKKREDAEQQLKAEQDHIEEERRLKEQAEADRKEKEKIQKQLRTVRTLLVVAVVALLLAVGGVWYALVQKNQADRNLQAAKLYSKRADDARYKANEEAAKAKKALNDLKVTFYEDIQFYMTVKEYVSAKKAIDKVLKIDAKDSLALSNQAKLPK
ncbi:MAG: hypothetical protein EAZ08_04260 [Cytophagales bacterium]|nr:MAG: hypothetical protein EAZ08_04260 [Cytophagales bacterium]